MNPGSRAVRVAGTGVSLGAALGMSATAQATDRQVTNLNDSGPGSLRQAIADSNVAADADRILFQSSLSGQLSLATNLPIVDDPLEIVGPGADRVTLAGDTIARAGFFFVPSIAGTPMSVSGLTMASANIGPGGGAIFSSGAALTLSKVVIKDNTTNAAGAGIFNNMGSLTIRDSTFSGN